MANNHFTVDSGFKNVTKYFAFYSQMQFEIEQSLNDRELSNYQQRYRIWEDRVRDRLIEIFETNTIKANEDVILKDIYAQKPKEFEKTQFMNKKGIIVSITDVYKISYYKNLDDLIKRVKDFWPDAIYQGIVIRVNEENKNLIKKRKSL